MILTRSSAYTSSLLKRKLLFLHLPIIVSLFILTDNESSSSSSSAGDATTKRHMALFTALSRHPPAMRVFRGLLEVVLMGLCASLILFFLQPVVGEDILHTLFFETPYTIKDHSYIDADRNLGQGKYELVNIEEDLQDELERSYIINNDEKQVPIEMDDTEQSKQLSSETLTTTCTPVNMNFPSPAFVILNMVLDLLLLVLIAMFLFTISSSAGGRFIDQTNTIDGSWGIFAQIGNIAAPTFPLLLFLYYIIRLLFPWTKRKKYIYTILSYCVGAPLYKVDFRDGFIGDICTSMVRPMQDIAFTSFYLFSGLKGWWIYHDFQNEDIMNGPIEKSWILHTFVLPACSVSPLWWRFCQCMRQTYDTKKRWPYLGNAAKYFVAAQVVMFGVFDPQKTGSFIWIFAFVFATLYQLWWDIFLDWELFIWCPERSKFIFRRNRLLQGKLIYFVILFVNSILRFGWTLTVIPVRYLSPSGDLLNTFSTDFITFIAPILACAEIIRRSLWGILRIELEAIKIKSKINVKSYNLSSLQDQEIMSIDDMESKTAGTFAIGTDLDTTTGVLIHHSVSNDVHLAWELSIYALVFGVLGAIAATHRQVL